MFKRKKWRFINTEIGAAAWNMAVDEALLEGFKEGDMPIFRLYGWEAALSAGRFSDIKKNVDEERMEADNIACVRRISGGGILVHGDDLSYALIMPREWVKAFGVKESYRYLCRFLLHLYETLGYHACFAADRGFESLGTDICLAGNEAYDIIIGEKKMGGNAQRHMRHGLLQHGTIPIRLDRALFDPLFKYDSGMEGAASLEALGCPIGYTALSLSVQAAFEEAYGVELVNGSLHPGEEERAQELLEHKYTQERWNRYGER